MIATVVLVSGCGGTTVSGTVPTPSATAARTPTPKPPTPSPTPEENRVFVPGPPGVVTRAQEGTATVSVNRYSWQRTGNGPDSRPPEAQYLVLDVTVRALAGKVQINPLYFSLRTAGGQPLSPVLGLDGNEPVLASMELNAPDSVNGLVAFDTLPGPVVVVITDELGNQAGQIPIGHQGAAPEQRTRQASGTPTPRPAD